MEHGDGFDPNTWLPIFPLPNCVLLPGGVVPLHIFEPRYREMMNDLLVENPLMAMALLKPGYEEKYYTHHAQIYPVVCLGAVLSHEQLSDGRFNLLLQGRLRARVRQEDHNKAYRRARLEVMQSRLQESHLAAAKSLRGTLRQQLESEPFNRVQSVRHLLALFDEDLGTADLCDLVAHALIPPSEVEVRQRLLETVDVVRRMEHLVDEVRTLAQIINTARHRSAPTEPQANN